MEEKLSCSSVSFEDGNIELRKSLNEAQTNLNRQTKQKEELTKQIKELKIECDALRNELRNEKHNQNQISRETQKKFRSEIDLLKEQNARIRNEGLQKDNEISAFINEKKQFEIQLFESTDKVKLLQTQLDEKNKVLSNLKTLISEKEEQLREKTCALEVLISTANEAALLRQKRIGEIKTKTTMFDLNAQMEILIDDATVTKIKVTSLEKDLETKLKLLRESQGVIGSLQVVRVNLTKENSLLMSERNKYLTELLQLKSIVPKKDEELSRLIKESEQSSKIIKIKDNEINRLTLSFQDLSSQLNIAKKKLRDNEITNAELMLKLSQAQSSNKTLQMVKEFKMADHPSFESEIIYAKGSHKHNFGTQSQQNVSENSFLNLILSSTDENEIVHAPSTPVLSDEPNQQTSNLTNGFISENMDIEK